jgi:hypothetical protein
MSVIQRCVLGLKHTLRLPLLIWAYSLILLLPTSLLPKFPLQAYIPPQTRTCQAPTNSLGAATHDRAGVSHPDYPGYSSTLTTFAAHRAGNLEPPNSQVLLSAFTGLQTSHSSRNSWPPKLAVKQSTFNHPISKCLNSTAQRNRLVPKELGRLPKRSVSTSHETFSCRAT